MQARIDLPPTDHPQLDRLMAFRAQVGLALGRSAVAYRKPLYESETNEARSATVHAQLWNDLLIALVDAFDGDAEEVRAAARDALEVRGATHVAGIPIMGTVVDDPKMGNRVVWNGGSKAARPDSLL